MLPDTYKKFRLETYKNFLKSARPNELQFREEIEGEKIDYCD